MPGTYGGTLDLFGSLNSLLGQVWNWVKPALHFIWNNLKSFALILKRHWQAFGHWLHVHTSNLWSALSKLRHFKWGALWNKLKRWYAHYQKWVKDVHDRFMGPIEALRKLINSIYDTFFKPIITILDSGRQLIQVLSVFDKKLAARLDQSLWALEGRILSPITAATQRLNKISSYFTSIITRLGLLDRPLLLESIRRDCSQIWTVLLNPWGKKPQPLTLPRVRRDTQIQDNYRQYLSTRTGTYAAPVAQAQDVYNQTFADLG